MVAGVQVHAHDPVESYSQKLIFLMSRKSDDEKS